MDFVCTYLPTEVLETKCDYKLMVKTGVTGPSSYSSGGFKVTLDLNKIVDAVVVLKEGNNLYKVGYTISGNEITIQVFQLGYDSSNSTLTISEVADGTDLSGLNFTIIAIGY